MKTKSKRSGVFEMANIFASALEDHDELDATFVGGSQPLALGKINVHTGSSNFVVDVNGILYDVAIFEQHCGSCRESSARASRRRRSSCRTSAGAASR